VEENVVEVEGGEGAAASFEFDVAHAAGEGWAAGCEEGVEHGAHGAEGVGSGAQGVADDVDLQAAGLGYAGAEFEAFEYFADGFFEVALEVAVFDAGYFY